MTSKRMIAGDIWRDDFVCSLSWFERLLWIGIIVTCADDQGRLQDRPKFLISDVFPNDENVPLEKVETAMQTFVTAGKIVRYEAGGVKLLQIVKWWEYQQPAWAAPSKYLAPDGWTDRVRINIKDHKSPYTQDWEQKGGFMVFGGMMPMGIRTPIPNQIRTVVDTGIVKDKIKVKVKDEVKNQLSESEENFLTHILGLYGSDKKFPKGSELLVQKLIEIYREYGESKSMACANWAFGKGMSLRKTVASMQTAIVDWTEKVEQPARRNGNGGHPPGERNANYYGVCQKCFQIHAPGECETEDVELARETP